MKITKNNFGFLNLIGDKCHLAYFLMLEESVPTREVWQSTSSLISDFSVFLHNFCFYVMSNPIKYFYRLLISNKKTNICEGLMKVFVKTEHLFETVFFFNISLFVLQYRFSHSMQWNTWLTLISASLNSHYVAIRINTSCMDNGCGIHTSVDFSLKVRRPVKWFFLLACLIKESWHLVIPTSNFSVLSLRS